MNTFIQISVQTHACEKETSKKQRKDAQSLQYVAVCCSVLQCDTVCCNLFEEKKLHACQKITVYT